MAVRVKVGEFDGGVSLQAEQLIWVDEHDREVGAGEKMLTHREGRLHRAFSVFIFDAAGRMLLQRRARAKYHSGGLWSNTACGHPRPGETTADAARRRLREEMNIDCELREVWQFTYRAELDGALVEHEFDHVFFGECETTAAGIAPNPDEVEDWRWVAVEELRRDVRARPDAYTHWFKIVLDEMSDARLLGDGAGQSRIS